MDGTTPQSFKDRLDEYYDWPCTYVFKFIAPSRRIDEVRALFAEEADLGTRTSKKGNYVSVTAEVIVESSDEVISVYRQAGEIEGLVAL